MGPLFQVGKTLMHHMVSPGLLDIYATVIVFQEMYKETWSGPAYLHYKCSMRPEKAGCLSVREQEVDWKLDVFLIF